MSKINKIVLFLLLPVFLHAEAGNKIAAVHVVGNQKIEKAVILDALSKREGEDFSASAVRQDMKRLYKLGYFDDIAVYKKESGEGLILTYVVKEKPTIRNIIIEGNKEIDTEDLEAIYLVKKHSFLDVSQVKKTQSSILNLYSEKGFFLADVRYELSEVSKNNDVEVSFHISEVDKVGVKSIHFIGNHAFKDDELKAIMHTKEKGVWSWITKSGVYQDEIFKRDVQQGLAYYYLMNGYVDIKIHEPQVEISPDKKWLYLTIRLDEGPLYQFGKVGVSGDLMLSQNQLLEGSIIKGGTTYNHDFVRQEILRLTNVYKDEGFAYANVIPNTSIERKNKKVDLVFNFEKGQKVHFGKIRISGNIKTRDKVLRRELKVLEGEPYNETRLQASISRLNRLGFFSEVDVQKASNPKNPNALDLLVTVKEKNTGSFNFGAGYSGATSIFLQASVAQNNLFGRGHVVNLMAQLSGKSQLFNLSFREPYLLDTSWNTGFDAFKTEREALDFKEKRNGGALVLGHSFFEFGNASLHYKLEDVKVNVPAENQNAILASENDGITSSMTPSFSYDLRDNVVSPTKGSLHSLSVEVAGLGGDKKFVKGEVGTRWYFPTFWSSVLRLRLNAGAIQSYGGEAIPTYEKFILGGANSLRGFRPLSLGPTKANSNGEQIVVGGRNEVIFNAELEIPLLKELQIKNVLFFDYGSAFDDPTDADFRADVGFGFRWNSPMGPLRLEWGFPVPRRAGELSPVFQFLIAPAF